MSKRVRVSVPLRGVGCFETKHQKLDMKYVSVPLRGVGCFRESIHTIRNANRVSVPLRGVGCFLLSDGLSRLYRVSVPLRGVGCFCFYRHLHYRRVFPSPCGVWVVSHLYSAVQMMYGFRPLAGCGLFRNYAPTLGIMLVSVPLRGVGCFEKGEHNHEN